jgi:NADPH:quinone reductase-like Zn-dependent oxidoreductase
MSASTRRRNFPSSQKCVVQADPSAGPGSLNIAYSWPLPKLGPRDVLVETLFVALNPCDVKIPAAFPSPGCIDGCDFAGIIVALGSGLIARDGVQESPNGNLHGAHQICEWDIGDRVFGAVSGSTCPEEKQSGSFAEFVKAPSDFIWRIPDGMSFEQAMGFSGVCITTLGVALFKSLQLPGTFEVPTTSPKDVLIYGGSTCTGSFGIQMVKL